MVQLVRERYLEGGRRTGGACTIAFLFRSRGKRYASTAGHCVGLFTYLEPGEERVWTDDGTGPVAYDRDGAVIGHFIYATWNLYEENPELPPDMDFGLIRLRDDVPSDPQVCHFGGPTGMNTDLVPPPTPVVLHNYGATPAGAHESESETWLLPARTHVALGMSNPRKVFYEGHSALGDSGSPLIDRHGRAVGIVSDLPGYPVGYPVPDQAWTEDKQVGFYLAVRLAPAVQRAEQTLGRKLRLLTARPL